ncbi:hypothetical protein, variant [Verruconis gallopava]|uniref:Zn(2)-C6 fungal-type domain-containing protein n=1 Tax=Verruconis gallopava TaxID=253628 RepID=A0A0D2ANF9_9PEZI|nr:hypothetical protein, variant [Verruconis gallopava]KIW00669.1 hypothetical protein, variant [Verruconis gallopava]
MAASEGISSRAMKNQVRIRGPKPDVCYHSRSLDELETLLRKHISLCKDKTPPKTAYAQFIFESDVAFQINDIATADGNSIREHFPNVQVPPSTASNETVTVSLPVSDAVAQVSDTKAKLRRQRAVGKAILRSIQDVDGFNYFEKEAWDTKHADGYRFKYLCKDSCQNKDRALGKTRKSTDAFSLQNSTSNNGAGTPGGASASAAAAGADQHMNGDQSPSKADSPARLLLYECKGSIFVKFSSSQQIVDVVYQHLPVHNASNERAPDTAEPSKSRANLVSNGLVHDDSAEPMDTSEMASYATPQAGTPVVAPVEDPGKGKKRKRTSTKPIRNSMVEDDEMSDLEPLDDDWDDSHDNNQDPPPPLVDPNWEPDPGDGDLWRPSVVTLIPGLKTQSKQSGRKSYGSSNAAQASASASAAGAANDSSASGSDFEGTKKPKKKTGPRGNKAGKPSSSSAAAAVAAKEKEKEKEREAVAVESDRGLRRRAKTGCWTCRNRKLKCDEARPQCSQCARSRPPRECSFPEDEDMSDAPPP